MKWLIVSIVVHILIILALTFSIQKKEIKQDIIQVEIKEVHVQDKPKASESTPVHPDDGDKHIPADKRIGSKESNEAPRSIGETLALENYLERLRARIEPNWIRILRKDVPKTKTRRRHSCLVVLNIEASPQGEILNIDMIKGCGWKIAENAALEAIQVSGIVPPPKEYLVNGIFYLQYQFDLRMK